MASVQHKDIIDPNIHEPKGIKFAAEGSAYVANGLGSGSWQEVLTPSSLGVTPSSVFTFSSDLGATELSSGVLFPGSFVETTAKWGDPRINILNGFLEVERSGIYLVSAKYDLLVDDLLPTVEVTLAPTKTSLALTNFQSTFFPAITGRDVEQALVSGIVVQLNAGQGFGFWATISSGLLSRTTVNATVQMTRLSDG